MIRILLADNQSVVRRGLRALLEGQRRQVCAEASSAPDAIRLALEHQPSLAIVGLDPLATGFDVAREILRTVPGAEIVIFSNDADEVAVRQAPDLGVKGYLLRTDDEDHIALGVEAVARREVYVSAAISRQLIGAWLGATADDRATSGGGDGMPFLTPREREVVKLIAEGCSNRLAADRLRISVKTVETHRAAAMRKLELKSAADLVRYAVRANLVQA
jgi:DNA-binding NarL/FixJ family response regulator